MAEPTQTLRAYLQARVQAEYRGRGLDVPGLVENFEAEDIPGVAPFSERRVRETIRIYFQERGFKVERSKFLTRYRGPNGENYGLTFTFVPRDHPLASGVSHRFRVSVLDFEVTHDAMRSDEVADAALECLAVQRGKDPDHFK